MGGPGNKADAVLEDLSLDPQNSTSKPNVMGGAGGTSMAIACAWRQRQEDTASQSSKNISLQVH